MKHVVQCLQHVLALLQQLRQNMISQSHLLRWLLAKEQAHTSHKVHAAATNLLFLHASKHPLSKHTNQHSTLKSCLWGRSNKSPFTQAELKFYLANAVVNSGGDTTLHCACRYVHTYRVSTCFKKLAQA